ncbi:MAG: type I-E CRISPR-associated endoribonuclease Cas2e, partial [Bacillota bacterium]
MEPRTGVFVGNPTPRVRELLWEKVKTRVLEGHAVLIHTSRNPQGYEVAVTGESHRIPEDFDGL